MSGVFPQCRQRVFRRVCGIGRCLSALCWLFGHEGVFASVGAALESDEPSVVDGAVDEGGGHVLVAEQAQRIFVVGRKNWLFSDAPRGARASAAIYSVTTTAKANGLNPRLYVEWLLTEMPNAGELTDEVVDSFLPWSDRVPESCKLDPAAAEKAKEMPDDFIINIDPDAFDDEMANNAEEGL